MKIYGEGTVEVFVVGVGKQRQRHRAEAGGAVDQDVEAAEVAGDLQRDCMDVVLAADVADDADGASVPGGLGHCRGGAGDESHAGAVCRKLAHERAAEAGRAAGHRDAKALEVCEWHECVLRCEDAGGATS